LAVPLWLVIDHPRYFFILGGDEVLLGDPEN